MRGEGGESGGGMTCWQHVQVSSRINTQIYGGSPCPWTLHYLESKSPSQVLDVVYKAGPSTYPMRGARTYRNGSRYEPPAPIGSRLMT